MSTLRLVSRPMMTAYEASLKIFGFRAEGSPNLGLKYLRKPLIGGYIADYYPSNTLSLEMLGNNNDKAYTKAERTTRREGRGKAQTKKGSGKMALKRAKEKKRYCSAPFEFSFCSG
ncbi:hypothetical protein PPL_09445 [Heterostelium album PN500]|uniref:Uncharacterized protein n=1 Tax=Heterostelium pallidum (strain ATCC 26659 / Pp 5 / PN500) TaxID=670386 RepID=D3BPH6_HETP5|nr:hypothetical protein PPL_09445 [Heterostelium album PN500]EFA76694.1 hypothetical protein PPL_09445 [Heterostelium album PN500]|eukprot:XP_020428826.1 hypothetical protein PPL_09445 [Heterostelium album PN500]